jgi:adenylate kinase
LISPGVFDGLAVSGVVTAEGEELEAVLSGLERTCRRGRHPDAVQRTDVEELAVEPDPAAPAENDIDLLGVGMAMGERASLAWTQAKERDTGALGSQRFARNARFPTVAEPVSRGRVVDRGQADLREGFRHKTPSLGGHSHHCIGLRDDWAMEPTVTLLGPPGSGKGTQAARLRDRLGFATLATGDLLREARRAGTDLGHRAGEYMDRGELVPDELIVAVLREAGAQLDDKPILLDGFPRTVAQADALAGALQARGRELTAAVLIDVPDDLVVERISGRHQDREDDRPETVRDRLRVYHAQTEPLVAYYDERGLLRRVDGAGDADAVEAAVRAAIDEARR